MTPQRSVHWRNLTFVIAVVTLGMLCTSPVNAAGQRGSDSAALTPKSSLTQTQLAKVKRDSATDLVRSDALFPGFFGSGDQEVLGQQRSSTVSQRGTNDSGTRSYVFPINGRGYGHGRGMSQWGAQGAALSGYNVYQIIGFYYPYTTLQVLPEPWMRVKLSRWLNQETLYVRPGPGTTHLDMKAINHPSTFRRCAKSTIGIRRTANISKVYGTVDPCKYHEWEGPLIFSSPDGIEIAESPGVWRHYHGDVYVFPQSASTMDAVNYVPMEKYLTTVVPAESIASWEAAALQAQAMAARSYAHARRNYSRVWDVDDTVASQVYPGFALMNDADQPTKYFTTYKTSLAVQQVANQYLYYGGKPALTEFSASSGGYSTSGGVPYLRAAPDPYSGLAPGDNSTRWSTNLSMATADRHCPNGGKAYNVVPAGRDGLGEWGGRITSARVDCTTGSVTVSQSGALRFGMKSQWWTR